MVRRFCFLITFIHVKSYTPFRQIGVIILFMITNTFFTELTKITDGEIYFSSSKSGTTFSVMSDTCPFVWSGVITGADIEFLDDTNGATLQAHVDGTPEGYNPAIFQTLIDLSHLHKVRVLLCVFDGTLHVTFFGYEHDDASLFFEIADVLGFDSVKVYDDDGMSTLSFSVEDAQ